MKARPLRAATVLMYHAVPRTSRDGGVDAAAFESHVRMLRRYMTIVSDPFEDTTHRGRNAVALTFDDGFCTDAEVVAPILKRYSVPATFFIASRHGETGQYLWFTYLKLLARYFRNSEFTLRGKPMDMRPATRAGTVAQLRRWLLGLEPHPQALYDVIASELPPLADFVPADVLREHSGMTREQLQELAASPLFSFGVHTVDHPMLSRCAPAEAERQISENRRWLEAASSRPCMAIAYPSGDYTPTTLQSCSALGFERGFAVDPQFGTSDTLEIPRIGIYQQSRVALGLKITCRDTVHAVRRWQAGRAVARGDAALPATAEQARVSVVTNSR